MAPSIERLRHVDAEQYSGSTKKPKLQHDSHRPGSNGSLLAPSVNASDDGTDPAAILPNSDSHLREPVAKGGKADLVAHPLAVKPLGNAFEATENIRSRCGSFTRLPDELIVQVLEFLDSRDLLVLGATCRAFFAFCRLDELWKSLYLDFFSPTQSSWRGSWRSTCLNLDASQIPAIKCKGLFSDVLHRPWQCAQLSINEYSQDIPSRNSISRFEDLSALRFIDHAQQPFILTKPVRTWPIYQDWSIPSLLHEYGKTILRAEAIDWQFRTYVDYMRNNQDESPLYLFDPEFAEKMNLNLDDCSSDNHRGYAPPRAFEPDLFDALADYRPNRRWLIIGPAGSGSTFHADPNGTSAWNAVIRGSKYWLMFPPPADGSAPDIPGIHVSADLSEVTAPLSLSEYLLTFHEQARRTPGCVEAVCHEGEVLYVPAGWYHMVVNLEEGIAVTQNFVGEANVSTVLRFLRDRPEQVTGFKRTRDSDHEAGDGTEFELFKHHLRSSHPEMFARAMQELDIHDAKQAKRSKWEQVTETNLGGSLSGHTEGFSFGFNPEDSDDLED